VLLETTNEVRSIVFKTAELFIGINKIDELQTDLREAARRVSRSISVLILRVLKWWSSTSHTGLKQVYIRYGGDPQPLQYPEDEDRDGPRNVGLLMF
jgi:hypothetical protein